MKHHGGGRASLWRFFPFQNSPVADRTGIRAIKTPLQSQSQVYDVFLSGLVQVDETAVLNMAGPAASLPVGVLLVYAP